MKTYWIKIVGENFTSELLLSDIKDIEVVDAIMHKVKKGLALNEVEKANSERGRLSPIEGFNELN